MLVRGLPNFSTTYNGREIFTAETRVVALQDFPSSNIAALEVFKTSTANLVEPGLAGSRQRPLAPPVRFHQGRNLGVGLGSLHQAGRQVDPERQRASHRSLGNRDRRHWRAAQRIGDRDAISRQRTLEHRFPRDAVPDAAFPRHSAALLPLGQPHPAVGPTWCCNGARHRASKSMPRVCIRASATRSTTGCSKSRSTARTYSNLVYRSGSTSLLRSGTATNPGNRIFTFQGATYNKTDTYQYAVGGSYEGGPLRITADVARHQEHLHRIDRVARSRVQRQLYRRFRSRYAAVHAA